MKRWSLILLVILLYALTPYFFLRTLNCAVSLKYSVFEPTDSYYYTTLKSSEEKEEYVATIKKKNASIKRWHIINYSMMVFAFIAASGLLIFRREIVKSNKKVISPY